MDDRKCMVKHLYKMRRYLSIPHNHTQGDPDTQITQPKTTAANIKIYYACIYNPLSPLPLPLPDHDWLLLLAFIVSWYLRSFWHRLQ